MYLYCLGVSCDKNRIFLIRRAKLLNEKGEIIESAIDTSRKREVITAMHIARAAECVLYLVDATDSSMLQKHIIQNDESFWENDVKPKILMYEQALYRQVLLKGYKVRNQ